MPKSDPFEAAFPGQSERIAVLRRGNQTFDELCADFAVLKDCIPEAALSHGDALDSLRALEREIRDWLANTSSESDR